MSDTSNSLLSRQAVGAILMNIVQKEAMDNFLRLALEWDMPVELSEHERTGTIQAAGFEFIYDKVTNFLEEHKDFIMEHPDLREAAKYHRTFQSEDEADSGTPEPAHIPK